MASVTTYPQFQRRPVLVPHANGNASHSSSHSRPPTTNGIKRSRDDEDDAQDDVDPRFGNTGSAKKSRLEDISSVINIVNKDTKTPKVDKLEIKGIDASAVENKPDNTSTAKSTTTNSTANAKRKAEKEKARAARLEAEEEFRVKYRQAFPSWKFYFDGVPSDAVSSATRRIEALGAHVQEFLSNSVTHFITPPKLDQENNGPSSKSLSAARPAGGLLKSPMDVKGSYDPLETAKKWGIKIWDISKLESVLDRTLARSHKTEEPTLDSFLVTDKTGATAEAPLPPSLKHLKSQNQVANPLARASARPQVPQGFPSRPANPYGALNPQAIQKGHHQKLFPKMIKNPSTALAGLLATEKATNMTMERDPYSKRHDYTYFARGTAFLIVEVVGCDFQLVGKLEYRATKSSTSGRSATGEVKGSLAQNFLVAKGGAVKSVGNTGVPEYPLLYMDPRMRSPFQLYNPKQEKKERLQDTRDREDREEREASIKFARAEKRRIEKASQRMGGLSATTTTTNNNIRMGHLATHNLPITPGRRIQKEFPTGSTDLDHRASGFLRSIGYDSMSTTGFPPTTTSHLPTTTTSTSRFNTTNSISGAGSWAKDKLFGVGGFVPGFGGASGVRKATQVTMRRGAFADAESESVVGRGLTRTATMPLRDDTSINAKDGADGAALRRTKSLVSMKKEEPVHEKPKEKDEKKVVGYCECCKEHYDSVTEHIKSKKHRKFATDPRRYKELDYMVRRLSRVPLKAATISEREERMRACRERYIALCNGGTLPQAGGKAKLSLDTDVSVEEVSTSVEDVSAPVLEADISLTISEPPTDHDYATDPDMTIATSTTMTSAPATSLCVTPVWGPSSAVDTSFGGLVVPFIGGEERSVGECHEVIVISSDAPSVSAEVEEEVKGRVEESFEFSLPVHVDEDDGLEITDVPVGWTR